MLTKLEQRLASKLLALAADEFGNHGCNDFNFLEHGFTKEEAIELLTKSGESFIQPENTYGYDFLLMRWLSRLLEEKKT